MAEVERKNGTDKKHSLSSFDKRKVQLAEFEGQHSKKYKISDTASGNTISPEKAQRMKTAAFMQYQNKEKKPGAASTSAREEAYSTGQSQRTINYSSNYSAIAAEHSYRQSEKSSVAERKTMSPEMADRMRKSAYIQQMNNKKSEAAINSHSREEAYPGQAQHTYSSAHTSKAAEHSYGQSEKSSVAERNTMSPEIADRMRKAAYIQQVNKEKVKAETAASTYIYSESKSVDVPERNYYSGSEIKTAQEQTKHSDKSYSEYSDRKSAERNGEDIKEIKYISPEMAQRMKRAAFIQQQNNEKSEQSRAIADYEYNTENPFEAEKNYSKIESVKGQTDLLSEDSFDEIESNDNPEIEDKRVISPEMAERLKHAAYIKMQKNRRKKEQKNESAADKNLLDELSEAADVTAKIGTGRIDKLAIDELKKTLPADKRKNIDTIQRIGNTVEQSDSVSSAVPDVITTLAINEAKKRAAKALKTDIFKKDKLGKTKHKFIDSLKDRSKVSHRLSPKGLVPKGLSREERKKYLHNVRVSDKLKSFYTQRLKKAQRNKQKEIFLKTNPIDFFLGKRLDISNYIKKKGMAALALGGGAATAVMPIFAIIIAIVILCIAFAWVQPPQATLIGASSKKDEYMEKYSEEGVNIKLNAELINNYFDMAEATYMYEFKEWYGGTYNWSDLFVSFNDWVGDRLNKKVVEITAEVRKLYEKELAAAKTPEEYAEVQK